MFDQVIEMIIKNVDTSRQSIYFQTIRDDVEKNNDSAHITCQFNNTSIMKFRTNSTSISGNRLVQCDSKVINSTNAFHYIFSIYHDTNNSKINSSLYINGNLQKETIINTLKTPDEIPLSNIKRGVNFIGRQKNLATTPYLKGVIQYIKIYQNAIIDNEEAFDKYWNRTPLNSNSDKLRRRHNDVNDYFNINSNQVKFSVSGSNLGLSNSSKT